MVTHEEHHDPSKSDRGVKERTQCAGASEVAPPTHIRAQGADRADGEDEEEADADGVDHDGDEDVCGDEEDEVEAVPVRTW